MFPRRANVPTARFPRHCSHDFKTDQVTSAIEPEDGNDEVLSTINVDEIEDLDYEIDDSKDHSLKVSEDDIIPGFIGWVQYGGNMLPGKVITYNKRKKSANIKFYDVTGLQTGRQTVNHGDIFCFGNEEQNEAIISGDEIVRKTFLWAKFEQEGLEKEDWLMWY